MHDPSSSYSWDIITILIIFSASSALETFLKKHTTRRKTNVPHRTFSEYYSSQICNGYE